jgi:hypothetical protein
MKLTILSAGAAALLIVGCGPLAAQQTGLEALGVLVRTKGAAAGAQVVTVSGRRGAEQPAIWRLVARDPAFAGHFREYLVKAGRVTSEAAVPTAESASYATAPLVRSALKIDSHIVFWRAHTEAKKVLVGFDTVDYELRNAEFSTKPVWVVSLTGRSGAKVGELAVSAETGNVLRRTWFEAGRQTAQRPPAASAPRNGTNAVITDTAQQAWDGTRTGWNQGKKAVKTGFSKASTTVGGWLIRAGGGTPPAAPSAATPPTPAKTAGSPPIPPGRGGPATWENGRYESGNR